MSKYTMPSNLTRLQKFRLFPILRTFPAYPAYPAYPVLLVLLIFPLLLIFLAPARGTALAFPATASASPALISVSVDRQAVVFPDQAPYVSASGSIMVPLRFVADRLGAEVSYDAPTRSTLLQYGNTAVLMIVGSSTVSVNGSGREIASAPEISSGRICVPLRFIAETLEYSVFWDSETRAAQLFSPGLILLADSQDVPGDNNSEYASAGRPDLGANADLNGYRLFPADNPWNQCIDDWPVDPNSVFILERLGLDRGLKADFGSSWNGGPFGIPYVVVDGSTPMVPMNFDYSDESDPGPYPIPADAPVEKGSDRHILVLDRDNAILYETWNTWPQEDGFQAGSGAIFDLRSNALRPTCWTSADAAGLPILPGLVRYQEVMETGQINHALRVTVDETRRAFVAPATHFASGDEDPALPPMGARIRLKSSFDTADFPPCVQVILEALKTYGMFVADNGMSYYISGAPDPRWNDEELAAIQAVKGSDLEIVRMDNMITGY